MQIITADHWTDFGESYERVSGMFDGAEADVYSLGITTVSTEPEPSEFPDTKSPTKQHTWAVVPGTYI